MIEVNAPAFGYRTRPDLERPLVLTILSNYRTMNPGVMTIGTVKRLGYHFPSPAKSSVRKFLMNEQNVEMARKFTGAKAGMAINAAKKSAPIFVMIGGERVEFGSEIELKVFVEGLVTLNAEAFEENGLKDARIDALQADLESSEMKLAGSDARIAESKKEVARVKYRAKYRIDALTREVEALKAAIGVNKVRFSPTGKPVMRGSFIPARSEPQKIGVAA